MTTAKYRRRARTRVRALTAARLRHRSEVSPVTGSSRTIDRVSRRKMPRKKRYSGPRGGGFGSTPTTTSAPARHRSTIVGISAGGSRSGWTVTT